MPPKVLLADEPTSALDVSVAAMVLNLLADLRRRLGFSMLFVTHDLAVARVVADRIIVMLRGSIVEQGPADEVILRPQNPYTNRSPPPYRVRHCSRQQAPRIGATRLS